MKTPQIIRIANPSEALVALIESALQRKKERMRQMREEFLKAQQSV